MNRADGGEDWAANAPGKTPAVQERPFSWSGVVLPRMLPSRPRLVAFRRSTGHQIDWERLTVRRVTCLQVVGEVRGDFGRGRLPDVKRRPVLPATPGRSSSGRRRTLR